MPILEFLLNSVDYRLFSYYFLRSTISLELEKDEKKNVEIEIKHRTPIVGQCHIPTHNKKRKQIDYNSKLNVYFEMILMEIEG